MSQRDGDAQILEQFLRTMAPPAALTATYRQRVVFASLDARTRVLQRRRARRTVVGGVLALCLIAGPIFLGMFALTSLPTAVVDNGAPSQTGSKATSQPATIDGFESALIQSQLSMRVRNWVTAQSAAAP